MELAKTPTEEFHKHLWFFSAMITLIEADKKVAVVNIIRCMWCIHLKEAHDAYMDMTLWNKGLTNIK